MKRRRRPTASIPTPADQQIEQRERRREGFPVAYLAGFDLSAEVSDICTPLAEHVAALPFPLACRQEVGDLVEAVHTLVSDVVGWLAASDAQQRVGHLTGTDRRRAVTALVDLTPRPRLLDVTDDMLIRAHWASALVAQAQPYSEPFADYLAKALPPGDVALISRDTPSASERLHSELRDVDHAARRLTAKIQRVAALPPPGSTPPTASTTEQQTAAQARAELAQLGVSL